MQAIGFLFVGLFGAVALTSARVTAVVLAGIIVLAFILALIFERRAFCNYLCPIGGFTGLYAHVGPVGDIPMRIKLSEGEAPRV